MDRRLILLGIVVMLGAGCATSTNNGNSNLTYCTDDTDCNHIIDVRDWVCCKVPYAPVDHGVVQKICAPATECCDCFGFGYCSRCEPGHVCEQNAQGDGQCVVEECDAPHCSDSSQCGGGELCCTDNQAGCSGCTGTCFPHNAVECTTLGWECGSGPYASADTPGVRQGAWLRFYKEWFLPTPAARAEARVSATFQWQHDAGRPPPHDLALGVKGRTSPLFQVFGRDGRLFARFGMQVVPLQSRVTYRLRLSLLGDQATTRAQAVLTRVRDGQPVLRADARIATPVTGVWRETLRSASPHIKPRVSLTGYDVQQSGQGGSVAGVECLPPTAAPTAASRG